MGRNCSSGDFGKNNRKTKVHLVFDADARRDFLSGFHSRKLQRKKKAKEEILQQLKEEKQRLKVQARDAYKKLIHWDNPVPQPEKLQSEEMQLENHSVNIIELSTAEIALKNKWIGINQVPHGENSEKFNVMVPGKFRTKKDLKKILKRQATTNMKKSDPIHQNIQLESCKNFKSFKNKNFKKKS